ncbi:hypothetical protein EIK77_009864 [Talaromyces pinophilus]|nr:hypothetical protein EIK77_009864 [Talaromyces pinophilus]
MADFSEFTGPSAEWLALESTLPPQPALSIEELQKVTNGVREKAATQAMVDEGVYIKAAAGHDSMGLPKLYLY